MAGMYVVSSKLSDGSCVGGEPYGVDNMEELRLILQDKLLDNTCQLFYDPINYHHSSFYGDINLVSGVPWPKMFLKPKWYRFRLLNAAISRPWLIKIKDDLGNDVSSSKCFVIAKDGGFRSNAAPLTVDGLLIAIAERYEMVCDFSAHAGKILYIWNDWDLGNQQKSVPYFCYSHLVARIHVDTVPEVGAAVFNPLFTPGTNGVPPDIGPVTATLSPAEIQAATTMALVGQFHRDFLFAKAVNGQWAINGETWDTAKIAAADVGQNTWEVWRLNTKGGWFHPVHVHLVDFYVIRRDKGVPLPNSVEVNGVRPYEYLSPADVVYLDAGTFVYLLVRFGAHKGGTFS